MSNRWKLTYADGSTNNIIADEDFCKKITSDGDTYEAIVPEPLHPDAVRIHAEQEARMWRNSQLEQTIKDLQGDLQTARRESVTDRKRVEVQKFKSRLDNITSDAKADKKISANELTTKVKLESERLRDSINQQRDAMIDMNTSPLPEDL